jgi:hypothetical protein
MKNFYLLTSIFFCILTNLYSQNQEGFDYKAEVSRMVKIPSTPEAEAFKKYGNNSVNMYTGTPNIEIPIYTYQGRELDLPIRLTYDASGIQVTQIATNVGLGWNLNVGGRITRIVNGLPDDHVSGSENYLTLYNSTVRTKVSEFIELPTNHNIFDTEQELLDHFSFLYDVNTNHIDTQGDYYKLNVLGLSEVIALDVDDNMNPKAVNNPRIKIEKTHGANNSLNTWTIYDEIGTKYIFSVTEQINTQQDPLEYSGANNIPGNVLNTYNTSWLLTRVESPNKKDIYEFNYTNFGFWVNEPPNYLASRVVTEVDPNQTLYGQYDVDSNTNVSIPSSVKQQFLTSIVHNGDIIVTNTLGSRDDIDMPSKLEKLVVKSKEEQVLQVDFDYSYFGDANSNVIYDKRLKLDKVTFGGEQSSLGEKNTFLFDYISPDQVPSRISLARDYYGYYNGVESNEVLYPNYTNGNFIFNGANRDPNFNYSKIGLLNKITYPTGGHTTYNYEPHKVYEPVYDESIITYLNIYANSNDVADPLLFSANGTLCDDAYLETGTPIIKMDAFLIPEQATGNGYQVNLSSNNPNKVRIFIVKIGELSDTRYVELLPDGTYSFEYSSEDNFNAYCDFFGQPMYWVSPVNNNFSGNIVFSPGVYKAMAVLEKDVDPNQDNYLQLSIRKSLAVTNYENVVKGGIRIKEITDYADLNTIALKKEYTYTDNQGASTAKSNYIPVLARLKGVSGWDANSNSYIAKQQLQRDVSEATTDQPFIVYTSVKETIKDQNGNTNGYTKYNFNSEKEGTFPRTIYPFQNDYLGGDRSGKLIEEKALDSDNVIKYNSKTEGFNVNSAFFNTGLVIYTDSRYFGYRIAVEELADGKHVAHVVEPNSCQSGQSGIPFCIEIFDLEGHNMKYVMGSEPTYATFRRAISITSGFVTQPKVTIKKEFYDNETITTTTSNTYNDASKDFLLKDRLVINSKGEELKQTFYYPKDFTNVQVYQDMINSNRLAVPVEIKSFKNNVLQSTRKDNYLQIGSAIFYPQNIEISKGNGSLEERIKYEYYSNGNIKETYIPNGTHTVYIWGYQDQYPIAKIENAVYSEVSNQVANLHVLADRDDDRTIGSSGNEGALRSALNTLRNLLPNALVTTYTYDPLIGATSITDPSGNSIYYHYDSLNRLKYIKNKDGEVLEENKYNYKLEELVATTTSSSGSVTSGDVVTFATNASGGSGNFTYKWTISNSNLNQVFNTSTGSLSVTTTSNHAPNFTMTCEVKDVETNEVITTTQQVSVTTNFLPLSVSNISYTSGSTYVGKNMNYSVSVSGGSSNYTYSWRKINSQQSLVFSTNQPTLNNIGIGSSDCNSYIMRINVTDSTTGETITKSTSIIVSSGCPSGGKGGNQQ